MAAAQAAPVLVRLAELYRRHGFDIVAGLNPDFWDGLGDAQFTWLIKDGASWTNGLGIAPGEVGLLEAVVAAVAPRRSLVIGNSFGWSALALGLMNPAAEVLALDAGFDEHALDGIELTNAIAAEAEIRVKAVQGVSPQDVGAAARTLSGPVDLVLVDGMHTDEQVVLDWRAARDVASPEAVFLFHDARAFGLDAGLAAIERESGQVLRRLPGTQSGMALLHPPALAEKLAPLMTFYAPSDAALGAIASAAWRRTHRRRRRWSRSLAKRRNAVRRLIGLAPLPLPD